MSDISKVIIHFIVVLVVAAVLAALRLVNASDYWVTNTLQLFHMLFKIIFRGGVFVAVQPVLLFSEGVRDSGFIIRVELISQSILDCFTHCVDVVFEGMLGINALLVHFVFFSELFSISDHFLDLACRKTALVIGDRNAFRTLCSLVNSGYSKNTVLVESKSDFNLADSSWCGWDTSHIKLSKLVVVFCLRSFTFENDN